MRSSSTSPPPRPCASTATGSSPPPRHPLLREAHAAIADDEERRDTKGWVGRLPKELKPLGQRLANGLVERGVLSDERRKLLGIFPTTRFPEADPAPEQALRERLRAVLLGEREPDDQDALLVALLLPYDLVRRLVPKDRRRQAKARARGGGRRRTGGRRGRRRCPRHAGRDRGRRGGLGGRLGRRGRWWRRLSRGRNVCRPVHWGERRG